MSIIYEPGLRIIYDFQTNVDKYKAQFFRCSYQSVRSLEVCIHHCYEL
jgi:hypothetical protein